MKKLFAIFLLSFLTVMCNAQEESKSKYSEMNQDQLNNALKGSLKSLNTAKIFTFIGTGIGIAGTILLIDNSINQNNPGSESPSLGSRLASIGIVTVALALPRWVRHSKRKKEIELELEKFKTNGSASIKGIGLKIRF